MLLAALLVSLVAAIVVVSLIGGGLLTALFTAGVTGYFVVGWPLVVWLFFVGGVFGAVVGVIALVVLATVRFRRAYRAHHEWLEPRVMAVLRAHDEGRLEDMIGALEQLGDKAFDHGCKTCLPWLEHVYRARSDLGSARWFVNEYNTHFTRLGRLFARMAPIVTVTRRRGAESVTPL